MILKNQKGFSLIELMVVVAIIAILSTIAIPNFQVFQAKARQKEGFALLGAYFNGAQASRTEYGFFPGEFPASGFAPVGMLGYRVISAVPPGYMTGSLPYNQTVFAMCVNSNPTVAGGNCPMGYVEWTEQPAGMLGDMIGPAAATMAMAANATITFTTIASGIVSLNAVAVDELSINETKNLKIEADGLK